MSIIVSPNAVVCLADWNVKDDVTDWFLEFKGLAFVFLADVNLIWICEFDLLQLNSIWLNILGFIGAEV